jgi:hypothetical protein
MSTSGTNPVGDIPLNYMPPLFDQTSRGKPFFFFK